ncbi:MAG: GlsB/YeaQ/YmgE family stress response membrane protein [Brevibacterium aurantiacum]|nr:GlsB/YeaQ/YmgE family stress response membrane protein [Brevibacterium aurantiacum]
MGFIAYLVLGLIAAVIAKMILPGRQGGGWIATLVVGVLGAIVGGWIGRTLFGVSVDSFFEISSWLCAIGGSIIVLIIWGLITRRKGVAERR